jgi:hypothetical protein
MQNSAWISILRQIPAEQLNNLMLVTSAGTEIAIQTLLRIDAEFVAVKGRLAGSQDAGRVFFIPYANIDYFGFQSAIKEAEFQEMFSSLPQGTVSAPSESDAPLEAPVAFAPSASLPKPPDSGLVRVPGPIKSAVLERFRSRVTSAGTTMRPSSDE